MPETINISVEPAQVIEVSIAPALEVDVSVSPAEVIDVTVQAGVPGTSAYQSALKSGFVGTENEWVESLKGGAYTHTQGVPADTWNVTHNLGYFPNVSVVDSAESRVEGDIQYVDLNSLIITFSAAFGGKAHLS